MADAGAEVDHEVVTMGGRARSKVGYERFVKFVSPFPAAVFVSNCVFLGGAAAIG